MRLTKSSITTDHENHYTPTRKLRGGADEYYIHYTKEGHGLAFTLKEFDAAAERFAKLDEGDSNFPHRWTFLRWLSNIMPIL